MIKNNQIDFIGDNFVQWIIWSIMKFTHEEYFISSIQWLASIENRCMMSWHLIYHSVLVGLFGIAAVASTEGFGGAINASHY